MINTATEFCNCANCVNRRNALGFKLYVDARLQCLNNCAILERKMQELDSCPDNQFENIIRLTNEVSEAFNQARDMLDKCLVLKRVIK